MMAMATAASAAAIAMMNRVKNNPSILSGHKYLLKAIKFRFTLFNISSILISMVIRFLRVKNPYTPIKNSAALINKSWYSPGCIILVLVYFLMQSQYIQQEQPAITYLSLQKAKHILYRLH